MASNSHRLHRNEVIALGGIPNKTQVRDMGIGGRICPVSSSVTPRTAGADDLKRQERWHPIQVKQKDKVGRPDVDDFDAMMMREDCDTGFSVSIAYSSDAMSEIGHLFKPAGKMIRAFTVRDILAGEIARKLA